MIKEKKVTRFPNMIDSDFKLEVCVKVLDQNKMTALINATSLLTVRQFGSQIQHQPWAYCEILGDVEIRTGKEEEIFLGASFGCQRSGHLSTSGLTLLSTTTPQWGGELLWRKPSLHPDRKR